MKERKKRKEKRRHFCVYKAPLLGGKYTVIIMKVNRGQKSSRCFTGSTGAVPFRRFVSGLVRLVVFHLSACSAVLHMTFSTTSNEKEWSKFKSLEVPYCSAALTERKRQTRKLLFHFIALFCNKPQKSSEFFSGLYL